MKTILTLFLCSLVAGCGLGPSKVAVSDPSLKPLWQAAKSFDRETYGFSPLPSNGLVRIEWRSGGAYDAMIHIYSKTQRTIAFRKTADGYRWIHEQESFQGPKEYTTVDGTFNEQIVLNYESERVAGTDANKLKIFYLGEDPRLGTRRDLTLPDVTPILREWGYFAKDKP